MKLRQIAFAFAASVLATPALGGPKTAAEARGPQMVERFLKGREILSAAAEATGGAKTIAAMTGVGITVAGGISNDVQGYSAALIGAPARDGEFRSVNQFDLAGGRFSQQFSQQLAGGFGLDFATRYAGGTAYNLRNNGRQYTVSANAPSPAAGGGFVAIAARYVPALLLQRALANFRSAAWVGDSDLGRGLGKADIVEFSWDETTRYRLYVARSDKKIRRVDALAPDAVVADDAAVTILSGDQTVAGLAFPQRVESYRRGVRTLELRVSGVEVNPAFADDAFAPPADYALVKDDVVRTDQRADGLYEVSGLGGGTYRSQFVVMSDFVVAFEAPLGLGPSRQIIAEIRKAAGEKPIRYVVVSHFHADHAGGVGAYADIGATVLSAGENRKILSAYAASRPAFLGLEGLRGDVSLAFEAVGREGREITDSAGRALRIVDIPGIPHVERMLALYDSKTETIINGDLFSRLVRWNETFDRFAEFLARGEPKISLVLGTHHEPLSREELMAIAAEAGAAEAGE